MVRRQCTMFNTKTTTNFFHYRRHKMYTHIQMYSIRYTKMKNHTFINNFTTYLVTDPESVLLLRILYNNLLLLKYFPFYLLTCLLLNKSIHINLMIYLLITYRYREMGILISQFTYITHSIRSYDF